MKKFILDVIVTSVVVFIIVLLSMVAVVLIYMFSVKIHTVLTGFFVSIGIQLGSALAFGIVLLLIISLVAGVSYAISEN